MIVAYDQNRGIGKDGKLLWCPGEMREDMHHFRDLTRGATVIMGRKTLESIGMALPNRRNIVISRNPESPVDGVEVISTIADALADPGDVFVIGGEQIYNAALKDTARIYATEVQTFIDGADTFFPELDGTWHITEKTDHPSDERNIYPYNFVTYERSTEYVNLANTRMESQRMTMEKIAQNAECPFCGGNLEKYHSEEILRQGDNWFLTPNQWPYEHTDTHLLAIPTYHAETLQDLRDGSFDELLGHLQWAEQEYGVQSGGIAMRFGDTRRSGATVNHLHVHFIVPALNKPDEAKVRFKIS